MAEHNQDRHHHGRSRSPRRRDEHRRDEDRSYDHLRRHSRSLSRPRRSRSPPHKQRYYSGASRSRSRSRSPRRDIDNRGARNRGHGRRSRSRSRSRTRKRDKRRERRSRSRSRSISVSSSSSSSSGSDRHKKRKRKDKHRKRSRSRDRDRKEKKKSKKDKKKKKKQGSATSQWGKYGVINDSNMHEKEVEFRTWLVEERMINPEVLSKDQTKKEFAKFAEDYNTATLPHEKYYNISSYERRMTALRTGELLPPSSSTYDPDADLRAHSSAHKKRPPPEKEGESFMNKEQLQDLRRVQAERYQVGKMKLMGMNIGQSFGVRMDGNEFEE